MDNIPFIKVDQPEYITPILATVTIGANYNSLVVYSESTFGLIGQNFTNYYQLIEHTFTQIISK